MEDKSRPGLLPGSALRELFNELSPFDHQLGLRPDAQLRTVLAANANLPLEVQARGFLAAAAEGYQSPLIIQLSYNALRVFGSGGGLSGAPDRRSRAQVLVDGALMAKSVLNALVGHYRCRLVALSLDHFRVPPFPAHGNRPDRTRHALARAFLEDAAGYMQDEAGLEPPSREEMEAFAAYLCSGDYLAFLEEFAGVVSSIRPAWGMIDTERLPPVLDCAVTREITGAVRQVLGNQDMMVEAEYGATGTAGEPLEYRRLAGPDLDRFAAQVAAFVDYTGADAIAYPIGMVHAAPTGERHEPDRERLATVQKAILGRTGRYVPFAQHGGTGAAGLARGLVGKNNVNTGFLVAGANAVAAYAAKNLDGIRRGDKAAAGVALYLTAIEATRLETIRRLQEAGTWQAGKDLFLDEVPRITGVDRPEPVLDPDRE
ncbi:MAG: class II fructose-bisphosphate aldolase [Bacillota bacterium]